MDPVALAATALGAGLSAGLALVGVTVAALDALRPPPGAPDAAAGAPLYLLAAGTLGGLVLAGVVAWRLLSPLDSTYRRGGLALVSAFATVLVMQVYPLLHAALRHARPGRGGSAGRGRGVAACPARTAHGRSMTALRIEDLGRRRYAEVLELQRDLRRRRIAGELAEDVLLLVEHPPVITLGRGTRPSSLPIAPAELERRGVEVFEVERGGDVTFHGPGQLVGYPILDLRGHRQDLHWYLRSLEDVLIQALGRLGIEAGRNPGLTGVWTAGRKIASIGIHVKQWVTLHGFALNVTTDLDPFDLIVPCGIRQVVMTSVAEELLPEDPDALMAEVRARVVGAFRDVFGPAVAAESGTR